jgi:hypothetical protein
MKIVFRYNSIIIKAIDFRQQEIMIPKIEMHMCFFNIFSQAFNYIQRRVFYTKIEFSIVFFYDLNQVADLENI